MIWNEDRLISLLDARANEGLTLELKRDLPGRGDKERSEFLKDVTAMANASGGSILYGLAERYGVADKVFGMKIDNVDSEIRRLGQMLETGVEPRLSGVTFDHLQLPGGDILAANIPESFDGPHRYLFNKHSKFVQRLGSHVSELSYQQLRAAFDKSATRMERLRQAWADDFAMKQMWRPIVAGPVCIVRLSPFVSADGVQILDPKVAHEHWNNLMLSDWRGASSAFNFQGLAVYDGNDSGQLRVLVQAHRTGALSAYLPVGTEHQGKKIVPSSWVGDFVIDACGRLISFAKLKGIGGSAVLNFGLRGLQGYAFPTRDAYGFEEWKASPLDEIQMPEIWIDDLTAVEEQVDVLLRPGFDLLWQTYGHSACTNYDENGRWKK